MIDVAGLAPWFALVVSLASLLYAVSTNRSKDTSEKFDAIDVKLETKASKDVVNSLAVKVDKVEDRVTVVENDLRHLPDKETTHRLEIALKDMQSEVGKLSERMKPIANMADRMQEAILEKVMS